MKAEFAKTGRHDCEYEDFLQEQRNLKNMLPQRHSSNAIAPEGHTSSNTKDFFWMLYRGDNMAPTVKPGEIVVARTTNQYSDAGIYLVFDGIGHALYRCQIVGNEVHMTSDNRHYDRHKVSLAWFNENVEAKADGIYRTVC